MIKLLMCNINYVKEVNVPTSFIKNKYSKSEYYLISLGLKKFYNISSFDVIYENGKPFIKDKNIYISISHDKDYVICAFSDDLVGCDIQFFNKKASINKLLNISEDINYIDSTILFSKKEAIVKLHGTSLKNINDYNIEDYVFLTYKTNKYVINMASKK